MDSRFENEFEQEEGRLRGRSRRRGAAVAAADSAGAAAEGFRRVHRMSSGTAGTSRSAASSRLTAQPDASERTAEAGGTGRRFVPAYERAGETKGSGSRDSAMHRGRGSRPGKEPPDPAKEKIRRLRRRIITMIVAECFLICLFLGVRYVKQKASLLNIDENWNAEAVTNPNISVAKEEMMKGYWTVALFGVDSRNNSLGKGNMADVIIICNINQETGEIKLVSVFRDTYLSVDDSGSYNKINQAYFRGGPRQAVEALNRNLDLEIDDYATFNWKAVADAINILGGVDVELSKAEFYYINAYITETVEATGVASVHLKQAGMNHLDGVQAVAYARLRKMDTDFARTERQRLIIQLCFDKLKSSNFSVVNNVMEVVFPQIMTSVRFDDLIPLAKNVTNYTIGDTMGFPAARGDANMGSKGDCVIPQTLESNVKDLHSFLFNDANYEPSDMVKQISAKISADSDMYKEAKPIESVGTDGGYIPPSTEAQEAETSEGDSNADPDAESSTGEDGETGESVLDFEYEWGLEYFETDEDGNIIDPPEDFDYGLWRPGDLWEDEPTESGGPGASRPGTDRPGSSRPSSSNGETEETDEGESAYGPGNTSGPGGSSGPSGSGQNTGGILRPDRPSSSESTSAADGPGAEESSSGAGGVLAPSPGAIPEETESGGPGAVIIGPGL